MEKASVDRDDIWTAQYRRWLEDLNAMLVKAKRPGVMGWDECTAAEELPAVFVDELADIMELPNPWLVPQL